MQITSTQQNIDIVISLLFFMHILLYFIYNKRKIHPNPYRIRSFLFWRFRYNTSYSIFLSFELLYDILSFALSLAFVISAAVPRILLLAYLPKIYKLTKIHSNCAQMAIGHTLAPFHDIFYGISLFLVVVSYIGCAFYSIDHSLYERGDYLDLLWLVQTGAMVDLVSKVFLVQLEYTMYWSIGTASTAAYGDISAADPYGVVFNVFCLLFEGFIYGFFISRMHKIPQIGAKRDQSFITSFYKARNNQNMVNKQQKNTQMQFAMLCSLEYYQSNRQKHEQLLQMLPDSYVLELKGTIYKGFIDQINQSFFKDEGELQQCALLIEQVMTEVGEDPFLYAQVQNTDLLYVKEGTISLSLTNDSSPANRNVFHTQITEKTVFNHFSFLTNLLIPQYSALCTDYCKIYRLSREKFRKALTTRQKMKMDSTFHQALRFEVDWINKNPLYILGFRNYSLELMDENIYYNKDYWESNFFCIFNPAIKAKQTKYLLRAHLNERKKIARIKKHVQEQIPSTRRLYKKNRQTINIDRVLFSP